MMHYLRKPAFAASIFAAISTLPVDPAQAQTTDQTYGKNVFITVRLYDPLNGNLLEESVNGITRKYTYSSLGDIETIIDPRGYVARYSDYRMGTPLKEVFPEARVEQVIIQKEVNENGNVIAEWRDQLPPYEYNWDPMGRMSEILYPKPGSSPEIIAYDITTDGLERKTSTRGPKVEKRTYDGYGRMVRSEVGSIKREYSYDIYGHIIFESAPYSTDEPAFGFRYEYDVIGRLIKRISTHSGLERIFTYSSTDNQPSLSIKDEKQQTSRIKYRSIWSPAHIEAIAWEPGVPSANIAIKRNIQGQPTEIAQNGVIRKYEYDEKFHKLKELGPETSAISYVHDANGNLTSKKTGQDFAVVMNYDGRNRLTSKNSTRPVTAPANFITNYTYDSMDRLTSAISLGGRGTLSVAYDDNGNMITETVNSLKAAYEYNTEDALNAIIYPFSRRKVIYQTDDLGRPTGINGYINNIKYSDSGHISIISYANGAKTEYQQDEGLRRQRFNVKKSNGTILLGRTYKLDALDNVSGISDAPSSSNTSFAYDPMNRLITLRGGSMGFCTYAYSGLGDMEAENCNGTGNTQFHYDIQRKIQGISGARQSSFSHDEAGNMTSAFGKIYSYSNEGKLASISSGSQLLTTFSYLPGTNKRLSMVTMQNGQTVRTSEFWMHNGNKLTHQTYKSSTGQTSTSDFIYVGNKLVAIWEN